MNRKFLAYLGLGSIMGMAFLALGWGFGNYYLVVMGFLLLAGSLAALTIPRP